MTFPDFCEIPSPGTPYPHWARLLQAQISQISGDYVTFRVVPCATATEDFFDQFPAGSTDPHPAIVIRDCSPPEIWFYDGADWVDFYMIAPATIADKVVVAAYRNTPSYPLGYGTRERLAWENITLEDTVYGTFDGARFTAVQAGLYRFSAGYSLRLSAASAGATSLFNVIDLFVNPTNYDHRDNINITQPDPTYGGANMVLLNNLSAANPNTFDILLPEDALPAVNGTVVSLGTVVTGMTYMAINDYVEAHVRSGIQGASGSLAWGVGGGAGLRRHEYFIVERVQQ